jgi:hypothetical protein
MVENFVTPSSNNPDLDTNAATPSHTPAASLISAHLEEVESKRSMLGRYPTHNPINKYSKGPMPLIQGDCPAAIFKHININLVREWEIRPGRKVLAVPFDPNVTFLETYESIRSRILTVIAEILSTQEVSVAASKPNKEPTAKRA